MTEDELDQESSEAFKKSLEEHFNSVDDYRRQGSIRHRLIDILFITICAVTSGANDLKAVAMYAQRKQCWLIDILALVNGVPSYTTFWTVFVLLSPLSLEKCFVSWVRSMTRNNGVLEFFRNLILEFIVVQPGQKIKSKTKPFSSVPIAI